MYIAYCAIVAYVLCDLFCRICIVRYACVSPVVRCTSCAMCTCASHNRRCVLCETHVHIYILCDTHVYIYICVQARMFIRIWIFIHITWGWWWPSTISMLKSSPVVRCMHTYVYTYICVYISMHISHNRRWFQHRDCWGPPPPPRNVYEYSYTYVDIRGRSRISTSKSSPVVRYIYGVATMSRRLKIIGLFCRI